MTFQTAPLYNWKFPTELHYRTAHAHAHTGRGALPAGTRSPWLDYETRAAQALASNNRAKELGMLGLRPTTDRAIRLVRNTSRSSVPNGVFPSSTSTTYSNAVGNRGGSLSTTPGYAWYQQKIAQRIAQIDALSQNVAPTPAKPVVVLPETAGIDILFSTLLDNLQTGYISSGMYDNAVKLQSAIIKESPNFTSSDIERLVQTAEDVAMSIESLLSGTGTAAAGTPLDLQESIRDYKKLRGEHERYLEAVLKVIRRIEAILGDVAKHVYEEPSFRAEAAKLIAKRVRALPGGPRRKVQGAEPLMSDTEEAALLQRLGLQ